MSIPPSGKKHTGYILLAVLISALGLRVWGISYGLPAMSHGDETEVVNHAVRFGSGDLNPHRFQYGTLMQYLLFALYGAYFVLCFLSGQVSSVEQFAAAFIRDPSAFYIIARTLSALFGTAAVYLAYRIGTQIRSSSTGLYAAIFLAVCFQHIVHSHYCTVDITMTFFFTLAVYLSIRLFKSGSMASYCAAGFAVGLAAAAKFDGIFAYPALVCAHLLRSSGETIGEKIWSPRLLFASASVLAGHFAACPFFYIEIASALKEAAALRAMHSFSGFNLPAYIRHLAVDYWGRPLGALCVAGLVLAPLRYPRRLMPVVIAALAVLLFKSMHRYVEPKYILHALPVTAVCGAVLFSLACSRLKAPAVTALLVILIAHPLYCAVSWNILRSQKSIDTQAREWIEEHVPAGSKILLDNAGNKGPKLSNDPANIRRQLARARAHNLMKAEHLELLLTVRPETWYDLVYVFEPAGFRADDFRRYRLWQDLEKPGHPPAYYRRKGFDYIVVTERYFSLDWSGFVLVRDFTRGKRGVRIYAVPPP